MAHVSRVEYHVVCVDDSNQSLVHHYSYLRDDLSALDLAAKLSAKTEWEVEIWEGSRFVARVKRDGTASYQSASLPA